MPDKNSAGAAESETEFSDRDLILAILNGIGALAARLGGGQLVLEVRSAATRRVVAVGEVESSIKG
jgi:hypothetical protein